MLTTAGSQGILTPNVTLSGLLHWAALGFLQEKKSQMRETSALGAHLQSLLKCKLLMVINDILWKILLILLVSFHHGDLYSPKLHRQFHTFSFRPPVYTE